MPFTSDTLLYYRDGQVSKLPVRIKRLDPAKRYRVEEIDLYPATKPKIKSEDTYPGNFLAEVGIVPDADAGHSSVVLKIN